MATLPKPPTEDDIPVLTDKVVLPAIAAVSGAPVAAQAVPIPRPAATASPASPSPPLSATPPVAKPLYDGVYQPKLAENAHGMAVFKTDSSKTPISSASSAPLLSIDAWGLDPKPASAVVENSYSAEQEAALRQQIEEAILRDLPRRQPG
jgi:hypothetical protein